MAQPAAVLSILVTANTSQATRGLVRFNTQLGATESSANKALGAVKTMAKGAAIGTGIGLGYAVKKAADFEQQLDSLGSVSGATGRQMEQFRKQAMKAGADTKFSALDAAEAQTELAKGGLRVRQIMRGGLRSALALAAAGEMELADAASTTANAMNLFGLRGKQSMKVADALAKAANATTADVSDFAMALSQGGAVAKSAGLSFTETVLALEALAASGIKNSDAGTSLKTSLIQLIKPTAKQKELADKLNVSFVDQAGHFKNLSDISDMLRERLGGMTKAQRTAALATLAGTDGVRTLTALYDAGPEKLDKWRKGLDKSGTAAKVAAEKQDNLKGRLENLQGSVETVAISIGSKMLPALTDAAEKITDLVNNPDLSAQEKLDKFGEMFSNAVADVGPKVAKAAGAVGLVAVRSFFNAFRESPLWLKLITAGFLISKFGSFSGYKKAGAQAGAAFGTSMAETAAATMGVGGPKAKSPIWGRKRGPQAPIWGITGPQAPMAPPGRGARAAAGLSRETKFLAGSVAAQAKTIAPQVRQVGKVVLGAALISGMADAVTRQGISGFGDRFQQFASTASLGLLPPPKDIQERLGKIAQQIQQWKSSGVLKLSDPNDPDNSLIRQKDLGDFTHRQRKMLAGMAELRNTATRLFGPGTRLISQSWVNPEASTKKLRLVMNEFGRMRNGAVLDVKEMRQVTSSNFKAIAETLGVNSKKGKDALHENFGLGLRIIKGFVKDGTLTTRQGAKEMQRLIKVHSKEGTMGLNANLLLAQRFIARTMSKGGKLTEEGMAYMRSVLIAAMKNLGLSPDTIRMSLNKRESAKHGPVQPGRVGMVVRGGKPTGDSVHALLERGEVVINRRAVQKMGGPEKVNRLNKLIPRFQQGGIPGASIVGGGGVVRDAGNAELTKYQRAANRKLDVLIGPGAPGGASFGPKGIGTYAGLPMANWVIQSLLYAKRKGVAPQPTSGYRSHAQNVAQGRFYFSEHEGTQYPHGAVDFGGYYTGLAEKLSVVAATSSFKYPLLAPIGFRDDGHASGTGHQLGGIVGMLPGFQSGGTVSDEYRRLIQIASSRYGIPARVLAGLIQVESGWNPNAVSSAGAFGLTQFMPGTASGYGVARGAGHHAVATQILGAAHYLKDLGYSKNRMFALGAYNGGPGNPQYGYAHDVLAAASGYGGIGRASSPHHPARHLAAKHTAGSNKLHPWSNWAGTNLDPFNKYLPRWLRRKLRHAARVNLGKWMDKTAPAQYGMERALAELTPGLDDDKAAASRAVGGWTIALAAAQRLGMSPARITTAATELKSAQDWLDDLTGLTEEQNSLLQQQIDAQKGHTDAVNALRDEQRQTRDLVRSQGPALTSALTQMINGGIGGNAGLGRQFPSSTGLGGLSRA